MKFPFMTKDDKSHQLMIKNKLANEKKYSKLECKRCGTPNTTRPDNLQDGFLDCSCGKRIKYNEKNVTIEERLEIKPDDYKKFVINRLKKLNQNVLEKFGHSYIHKDNYKIPLIFLELDCSSGFLEALKTNSLIIYYSDASKRKMQNTLTKPNFVSFYELLESEMKVTEAIKTLSTNYSDTAYLSAKERISQYARDKGWEEFEKETQKLFEELRTKQESLNSMLSFFKKHENAPLGRKFIQIGGNHPVDVESISLFEYLNALIDFEKSKGIDAKCYSRRITLKVYDEKVRTNRARGMIFVTNQNKVSKKVWKKLLDAKKDNQNRWYDFIVDLDILSILLVFLKLDCLYRV